MKNSSIQVHCVECEMFMGEATYKIEPKAKGNTIVLFHELRCPYCGEYTKIIQQDPGRALINVSLKRSIK
jgi:hypothetical protein